MKEDHTPKQTVTVESQVGTTPLPEDIKKRADIIRKLMDTYSFDFHQAASLIRWHIREHDAFEFYNPWMC